MIESRPPRGVRRVPEATTDQSRVSAFLEDSARFRGGHASVAYYPTSEAEVAAIFDRHAGVLAVGAQSSLTGGATPFGEAIISTSRMNSVAAAISTVRAGAGVLLSDLHAALTRSGAYYPPLPTFLGATVGGAVATNAAGAATFKYGTTRSWVEAMTVVLASGDVLDLRRGEHMAGADGFRIRVGAKIVHVPLPAYTMPRVAKLSAGYFAEPGMDLIDLFVGSEGTLGLVVDARLRIVTPRPAACLVFVTFSDPRQGYECARALRVSALRHRDSAARDGIDVAAIEHMDRRCLTLLRDSRVDRDESVSIDARAALALLVAIDLPAGTRASDVYDALGNADEGTGAKSMLGRFTHVLEAHQALGAADIAVPGDTRRHTQLLRVREAVPTLVNQQVRRAGMTIDRRIEKIAADVIVPFDRLTGFIDFIDAEFTRRNLDGAVWGHLSDGNLHPNVIARSFNELESGREAMLAIGREATRLGGAPMAEHGVGRNQTKQRLLEDLYGTQAIEEMRAIKRALDPEWKLAPGVIFPR